jgi:diguanylate cyclase (GGDEF)-like protein
MKQSIKAIFSTLNKYLLFVLLVATIALLFTLEHSLSFQKVDNLNHQKKIIATLTHLDRHDLALALIQFNGKSTQLHQEIDKLRTLYKYAYIDKYLVGNQQEYFNDLKKLSTLTDKFNAAAQQYYVDTNNKQEEVTAKVKLDTALSSIIAHIDTMLLKTIKYNEEKFHFIKNLVILFFIITLLATFYFRKQLKSIYRDISYLYHIDKQRQSYTIFSQEADAIALRMNRKNVTNDNPDFIDQATSINNYKGMVNAYSIKKGAKESNFTSVTVLEIDNFSKSNRAFSQDIMESILKKIAYTISLHEQPIDVIARTDYNQFTLIFSRSSKEQAFKDVDLVRQSIEELKFHIPNQGMTQITVSGGFIIKPNNTSLEEAMKQAKEILHYAQSTGKNKILQLRDLAQKDM